MIIIEMAVALVLILFILSLLASSILEGLSLVLGFRNRKLLKALQLILGSGPLYQKFIEHPGFMQLGQAENAWRQIPSFLEPEQFASLLQQQIDSAEYDTNGPIIFPEGVPKDLQENLQLFWKESDGHPEKFAPRIEKWYESIMQRFSKSYKIFSKKALLVIGLVLCLSFNLEVIALGKALFYQAELRNTLEVTARQLSAEFDDGVLPQDIEAQLKLLFKYGAPQLEIFPWGWNTKDSIPATPSGWAWKVIGWLLTSGAIAMGAPFWYDLLKKVLNIKG